MTRSGSPRRRCRGGIRFRSRATTFARRVRPRSRSWRSPSPTVSPMSSWRCWPGWPVDSFAPRLSFFFNAHIDFFEEIAKYRAARRIWARWLRERYGAQARTFVATAVPHPDRRCVADRATARGQHRPHRDRSAGRCAGWHAVAAHQFDGRSDGTADRENGAHRAAHATGDRARDQRRPCCRPARWVVVRRTTHRRGRTPGRRTVRLPRQAR